MNPSIFEDLLHEEESATLDFKSRQYQFAKADKEAKSEILKDILGFANAWRRTEAYILIGVKEVIGGRSEVVGIEPAEDFNDHTLQQFVNSVTNRPVLFNYKVFSHKGKQVGVLTIEQQDRPIYLRKDYGKLQKDKVYVRRGSSTDPQNPASPDEVAGMGKKHVEDSADIQIEFADSSSDETFGSTFRFSSEFCQMPPDSSIPDLEAESHEGGPLQSLISLQLSSNFNRDFYRELARYTFEKRLLKPLRISLKNVGQATAKNARLEIRILRDSDLLVLSDSQLGERPEETLTLGMRTVSLISTSLHSNISISENEERILLEGEFGDIQPGRRIFSDIFFVGSRFTQELRVEGLVFGENIPNPVKFDLTVYAEIEETTMSITELFNLPSPVED